MKKVFLSPGKFILGKDELVNLGSYIKQFGTHALLIAHPEDSARVGHILEETCKQYNINLVDSGFEGECTYAEVERAAQFLRQTPIKCVIGLGGGKALDTAKCLIVRQLWLLSAARWPKEIINSVRSIALRSRSVY